MPHIQNENYIICTRVQRGFSKERDENSVMIHNDFAKRASTINRGINEGSKVMFGFSMCDTKIRIIYSALLLSLLKENFIIAREYLAIKQPDPITQLGA